MRTLRGGSPKSRGHEVYHIRQANQRYRKELQAGEPSEVKGVQWHRVIFLIIVFIILLAVL